MMTCKVKKSDKRVKGWSKSSQQKANEILIINTFPYSC